MTSTITKFSSANSALVNLTRGLMNGPLVDSRNGKTREFLMGQFHIMNPLDRYLTVPERSAHLPAQIYETMWVLSGSNDISVLKEYLPKAPSFSDDGATWRAGYGPRLRSFGTNHVDQLAEVVDLLQESPETRQAVISIFDGNLDHTDSLDIPCNNWLHFISRGGKLNLHVATRSNDLMWGWSGINNFEWSVLLEIVAYLTNLQVGTITYSISSLHLYERHFAKAQRIIDANEGSYLSNPLGDLMDNLFGKMDEPQPEPRFDSANTIEELDADIAQWHKVEELLRTEGWTGRAAAETVKIRSRLFKAFAHCLAMWYEGDYEIFPYLENTQLMKSLKLSPVKHKTHRAFRETEGDKEQLELAKFMKEVDDLHREKNSAYGNSWRKRGEVLGIMANLARKIDRLGANGAGETALDTVTDLAVYAVKYHVYLCDEGKLQANRASFDKLKRKVEQTFPAATTLSFFPREVVENVDNPDEVTKRLMAFSLHNPFNLDLDITAMEAHLREVFTTIENMVLDHNDRAAYRVDGMGKLEWVEYLATVALATAFARKLKMDKWKAANSSRRFSYEGE